jgi:hypothetical protein
MMPLPTPRRVHDESGEADTEGALVIDTSEVGKALRDALHELAPAGGTARLEVGATADALVALLADVLAVAPDAELERAVAMFRTKLSAAIAARSAGGIEALKTRPPRPN